MKNKILTIIIMLLIAIMLTGCEQQQIIPVKQVTVSTEQQPIQKIKTPETQTPKTYNVEISGFAFNQSTLIISSGDTVIWTNQDSAPHTITSDSGTEIRSQGISKGGTYLHTFTTAGTYTYHCEIHPLMKAIIIVE